jgi:hypothetical protein
MSTTAQEREHILNLKDLPETKSKDKLFVRFNSHESKLESEIMNREVSVYDVLNMTKHEHGVGSAYEVKFYRDAQNNKVAVCNCDAFLTCKHIIRSVVVHVARKTALEREAKRVSDSQKTDESFWKSFATSNT